MHRTTPTNSYASNKTIHRVEWRKEKGKRDVNLKSDNCKGRDECREIELVSGEINSERREANLNGCVGSRNQIGDVALEVVELIREKLLVKRRETENGVAETREWTFDFMSSAKLMLCEGRQIFLQRDSKGFFSSRVGLGANATLSE
ncbi:unnamed protein product [Sphenostylis stenocarpa]|uniref:Uncharacterized protein n=1 Tax=Sphenostylis stenocarpa TaxID=92480 RepID=A0AA86SKV3_9FABA|nr:unnamed protein product [Sphenostylis stenocarpa]